MKQTLCQCGWAASRTKNTYYRAKYESVISKKGSKKATIILGHKILCCVYRIITTRQPYKEIGPEWFEKNRKDKRIAYLKKELKQLETAA